MSICCLRLINTDSRSADVVPHTCTSFSLIGVDGERSIVDRMCLYVVFLESGVCTERATRMPALDPQSRAHNKEKRTDGDVRSAGPPGDALPAPKR